MAECFKDFLRKTEEELNCCGQITTKTQAETLFFKMAKKIDDDVVKIELNPYTSYEEFVEGTFEEFKSDTLAVVPKYMFERLTTLKTVDLHRVTEILVRAFFHCTALEKLIIRTPDTVCNLVGDEYGAVFSNTPIANGEGGIFVPAELVEAYKANEAWSKYASVIFPIVDFDLDTVINRNVSGELYCAEIKKVRHRAFYGCDQITRIEMPRVESVGNYAFGACKQVEEVILPKLKTAGEGAFSLGRNAKIKKLDFPLLEEITGSGCFMNCSALEEVNFPNLNTIMGVTVSNIPNETSGEAFYGTNIKHLDFPNLTNVCLNAFSRMFSLITAKLPKVTRIPTDGFASCTSLEWVDAGMSTSIGARAFMNCSKLKTIILRNTETICANNDTSSRPWFNTPFASGGSGGVVLVPSALVETYKTATNWSTLVGYGTCTFLALEDYTVDGTTTGEIDWDKLNAR